MGPISRILRSDQPERNYWLLITSEGYWRRMKELGKWAFAESASEKGRTIEEGDLAVVYLTQEGREESSLAAIIAFSEGLHRTDSRSVFDHLYPLRKRFRLLVQPSNLPPFRPVANELEFVGNPDYYGAYLQGKPIRALSEEDFKALVSAIQEKNEE